MDRPEDKILLLYYMVQGLVTYLFYEGERSEPRKKDMSPARGPYNFNAAASFLSALQP